jgi:hypothetical protein
MESFILERDWNAVRNFWSSITLQTSIPQFIIGDVVDKDKNKDSNTVVYGVTDLQTIHRIGKMKMYIYKYMYSI